MNYERLPAFIVTAITSYAMDAPPLLLFFFFQQYVSFKTESPSTPIPRWLDTQSVVCDKKSLRDYSSQRWWRDILEAKRMSSLPTPQSLRDQARQQCLHLTSNHWLAVSPDPTVGHSFSKF